MPSQSKKQTPPFGNGRIGPFHLMIVPGPGGGLLSKAHTWMIVRIELNTPVARGFATKEQARAWIGRAVRAGVLPSGVMEVEPGAEEYRA